MDTITSFEMTREEPAVRGGDRDGASFISRRRNKQVLRGEKEINRAENNEQNFILFLFCISSLRNGNYGRKDSAFSSMQWCLIYFKGREAENITSLLVNWVGFHTDLPLWYQLYKEQYK